MTFWMTDWLRAFVITTIVELAIAVPWLRHIEPRPSRRIAGVLLANVATHPLVWFLFPGLLLSRPTQVTLSEIWAVVAEAGAYAVIWPALGVRRASLLSLIANGGSFLLGLLVVRA